MSSFERRESEVRSYSRRWPALFGRAAGSWLYGVDGTPYLARVPSGEMASWISTAAFERGLLVETCGPEGEVVKLLPPLTVAEGDLDRALHVLNASVRAALANRTRVGS